MRWRLVVLVAPGLLLGGCVLGSASRPSRADTQADLPPPQAEPGAGELLLQSRGQLPTEAPDAGPRDGGVWVDGYWHWDGVRHVWVPGRWQPAAPYYQRDWAGRRPDSGR
jgi:hypothetical protein